MKDTERLHPRTASPESDGLGKRRDKRVQSGDLVAGGRREAPTERHGMRPGAGDPVEDCGDVGVSAVCASVCNCVEELVDRRRAPAGWFVAAEQRNERRDKRVE